MLRRYVLALMVFLALIDVAGGEVVEIPLPGLTGHYPDQEIRFVDFSIDPMPSAIHEVHFRTSGYFEAGLWQCIDGTIMCWPMIVDSKMHGGDPSHDGWWYWYFMGPCADGEMTVTCQYEGSSVHPPDWDFLLDGEGRLSFMVAPDATLGDCHPISDWITAEIYEAVLIIHMDPLVPVETMVWGQVKTLYH